MSLPEIDGAIEPIIYGGRDGVTGRTVPLPDRINLLADRALKWANLRMKKNKDKRLAISIFSFPPDKVCFIIRLRRRKEQKEEEKEVICADMCDR